MSFDPKEAELQKETHDVLRFLLRDQAFSEDFLLTAIQEYFRSNSTKNNFPASHAE